MGYHGKSWRLLLIGGALGLVLTGAVACGDDDDGENGETPEATSTTPGETTPAESEGAVVNVQDNSFSPASVTIGAGEQVEWRWGGANAHSVVFDDGTQSEALTGSGTFTRTFAEPGTYPYLCGIHGASMAGTVVVE